MYYPSFVSQTLQIWIASGKGPEKKVKKILLLLQINGSILKNVLINIKTALSWQGTKYNYFLSLYDIDESTLYLNEIVQNFKDDIVWERNLNTVVKICYSSLEYVLGCQ